MVADVEKIKGRYVFYWAVKVIICSILLIAIGRAFFLDGINPYYSYKDYKICNDSAMDTAAASPAADEAVQDFIAKGNILSNIFLYIGENTAAELTIKISDKDGRVLKTRMVQTADYTAGQWRTIAVNARGLKRGGKYSLVLSSANTTVYTSKEAYKDDAFSECRIDGNPVQGSMCVGFGFTYRYLTPADVSELFFDFSVFFLMACGLCFAVLRFEILYAKFREDGTGSRQGILYAVYLAVSLIMLFNPLDKLRNEVTAFKRMIGAGVAAGADVSKRIGSFHIFLLFFALFFVLFYLLANYVRGMYCDGQKSVMAAFLDRMVVLFDVNLLFRCITYFQDESAMESVFYYSSCLSMLVFFAGVSYLVLGLNRYLKAWPYIQLLLMVLLAGYPLSVIFCREWQQGRFLIGVQAVLLVLMVLFVKFIHCKKESVKSYLKRGLSCGVVFFSLCPFLLSFYIEFVNILNQYSVFVAEPKKYFILFMSTFFVLFLLAWYLSVKRNWEFRWWKRWAYPWIIFGISCLSVQISLEGTYNADIFETANSSILISDFLNFGAIPIMEHYGGHMMESVWEGFIYALLNQDAAGAVFSPYAGYARALFAVLFFYLVKHVCDEDTAFYAALLFPFYGYWWSAVGFGMLVCLAVMAYIRKNTYKKAFLVWFSFIWCVLYRLDLGTAFGIACMATLCIFAVVHKNRRAGKQLLVSLLLCGLAGLIFWCFGCILKGIHPLKRLFEFVYISLSNQNWAFEGIGDAGNTIFAWGYFIIPCVTAVCLLYTVFSKKFREHVGMNRWIILLLFGFSYFANFQRGLTRHTIEFNDTRIVLWTAYIFLAVFISCYKNRREWFLPAFAFLLLCNTLLIQDGNFTAVSIADSSVSHMDSFVESWSLGRFDKEEDITETYWEEIGRKKKPVTRIQWEESLKKTLYPYKMLMETLLGEGETFIDYQNRTFLYSVFGRRNPVYVSQSPGQLSGEFAQEQFVQELRQNIEKIPLAVLPLDPANVLDGIANDYRYYKVAEFIYGNYVPLCRYGNFALWCLPQCREEMMQKLSVTEYMGELLQCDALSAENCSIKRNAEKKNVVISSMGEGAVVDGLEKLFDTEVYDYTTVKIFIDYETNVSGAMQIFYTEGEEEEFTGEKVSRVDISGSGTAEFAVPVTSFGRLRLSIPDNAWVAIKSFRAGIACLEAEYGYDGPTVSTDEAGNTSQSYTGAYHNYTVKRLPLLWAERDRKDAASNTVLAELAYGDGYYRFERAGLMNDEKGNYLLVSAEYAGSDQNRFVREDDEYADAVLKLGTYENGKFVEKYQYSFAVREGRHNYLIRVSSDYYWNTGGINAVSLQSDAQLYDVDMKILEGD